MSNGKALSRRGFIVLAGTAAMLPSAGVADGRKRLVVVELFTSQGCSSCPEADAILAELSTRPGVLALSLNVDYWDYLGWRDTLGSPDHTKRQRAYAQRRGDGQVYTPQMVFNARRHVAGSRRDEVYAALAEEADAGDPFVPMGLREQNGEVVVDIGGAPTDRMRQDSTVWVLMVTPKTTVTIERGENTGRQIEYTNVVRRVMPAGMWHGDAVTLKLPKADLFGEGERACATLLQVGGTGPVIGAAWMAGPDS